MQIRSFNLGEYIVPEEIRGGICVDIGANVGSFIKKYYNHFNKIYYFEPIKQCFDICQDFSKNYCENSKYQIFLDKNLSPIKYIAMEIHWQMGELRFNELVNYISKTHALIRGNVAYIPNYNKEVLFKRK